MKDFVKDLVEEFNVSPEGVHFAIVQYSTRPRVKLSFKGLHVSYVNTDQVKRRVDRMRWDRGFTFIDRALKKAETYIFTTAKGMRKGVPTVSKLKLTNNSNIKGVSNLNILDLSYKILIF